MASKDRFAGSITLPSGAAVCGSSFDIPAVGCPNAADESGTSPINKATAGSCFMIFGASCFLLLPTGLIAG